MQIRRTAWVWEGCAVKMSWVVVVKHTSNKVRKNSVPGRSLSFQFHFMFHFIWNGTDGRKKMSFIPVSFHVSFHMKRDKGVQEDVVFISIPFQVSFHVKRVKRRKESFSFQFHFIFHFTRNEAERMKKKSVSPQFQPWERKNSFVAVSFHVSFHVKRCRRGWKGHRFSTVTFQFSFQLKRLMGVSESVFISLLECMKYII
jgi:hypothetical protein